MRRQQTIAGKTERDKSVISHCAGMSSAFPLEKNVFLFRFSLSSVLGFLAGIKYKFSREISSYLAFGYAVWFNLRQPRLLVVHPGNII